MYFVLVSNKGSANCCWKIWWLLGLWADQIVQKSSWKCPLKEKQAGFCVANNKHIAVSPVCLSASVLKTGVMDWAAQAASCCCWFSVYNHLQAQAPLGLEPLVFSFMDYHPYIQWLVLLCGIFEGHRALATAPAQMSVLQIPLSLLDQNTLFQGFRSGLSSGMGGREHRSDVFSLFLDCNFFIPLFRCRLKGTCKDGWCGSWALC